MEINNKSVKAIRPITEDEWSEYTRNREPLITNNMIFCIEFDDGSILFPNFECCKTMKNSKCMFISDNKPIQ